LDDLREDSILDIHTHVKQEANLSHKAGQLIRRSTKNSIDSYDAVCYNFYNAVRHESIEHFYITEVGMKCMHKIFLFTVGIITIAFDEISDSIKQALITIQEEREKLAENLTHQES
jgi:hypothetical protein